MRIGVGAWVLAASVGIGALVFADACVGEDPPVSVNAPKPDDSKGKGEYLGHCNDGRCFPPLVCNTANDVCLYADYPDGGLPPNEDGATSSSGGSSSGSSGAEAGPVACPLNASSATTNTCPGTDAGACTGNNDTCCLGPTNECHGSPAACNPKTPIRCNGKGTCAGEVCCLKLAFDAGPIPTSACPSRLTPAAVFKTDCLVNCDGDDLTVCRNDSECTSGKCRRVVVATSGGDLELGVCL